jgi:hypothetical protein
MSRPRKTAREKMSEWVLHCAVNQRHIRRSQPTREAALRDACSQLLEGHAVQAAISLVELCRARAVLYARGAAPDRCSRTAEPVW